MTVRELHELFDRYTVFDFEYEVGHHMCFGNDGRYLRKFYDYEIIDKIHINKNCYHEHLLKFKCRKN